MERDYKDYLSKTAKQMILIHDASLLSRLVIRTLIRTLKVKTAGLFIYNKQTKEYIIKVSKGEKSLRIPVGFTKIKKTNTIVKFFLNKKEFGLKEEYISVSILKKLQEQFKSNEKTSKYLNDLSDEMSLYGAELIVPGFFREDLIVVFFISSKADDSNFSKEDIDFLTVLSSDVVMAIQNAQLFENIKKQLDINKRNSYKCIR